MTGSTFALSLDQSASAKSERILWIDVSKGIGIFLVVVGHAVAGLIDARLDDDHQTLRTAFVYIYVFHMPLFFLLSGLTVRQRVEDNPAKFAKNILLKIVYPYYLWSMVQLAIIASVGNLANTPFHGSMLHQFLTLPWNPGGQFWFLQVLTLLHLSSLLLLARVGPTLFSDPLRWRQIRTIRESRCSPR